MAKRIGYLLSTVSRRLRSTFVLVLFVLMSPVNAYETDLHYGLTYWLSIQGGFSPRESHEIARADEWADRGNLDAKYQIIWRLCVLRQVDAGSIVRELHFRSETNVPAKASDRPVAHDPFPSYAGSAVDRGVRDSRGHTFDSLWRLGSALHGWQDAYSHFGEPTAFWICNDDYAWAHPKAWGGAFSHQADTTYKRPDDCLSAAETTFQALQEARARGWPDSESRKWGALVADVRDFCVRRTKSDKFDWLEKHGVPQAMAIAKSTSLRDGRLNFRETPEVDLSGEPVKDVATIVPAYRLGAVESTPDETMRGRIGAVVADTPIESPELLRRWFNRFLRAWLTTPPAAMPAAVGEALGQTLQANDTNLLLRLRMLDQGATEAADIDAIRGLTSTVSVVMGNADNYRELLVPVRARPEDAGLIGLTPGGSEFVAMAILRNSPSDVLALHGQIHDGKVYLKSQIQAFVFH